MQYFLRPGAAILLMSALSLFGASGIARAAPAELEAFRASRTDIAADLAAPIATCVMKHDTSHSAFHGCIDWHSAVHGVWALTAFSWATGDQRYRATIELLLQPALVAQERNYLADHPGFEMPYGRAWFLRLAIDYRKAFGTALLDGMADDVAQSLVAHYKEVTPDPTSSAYDSATWALINLYDYAVARQQTQIEDFVKAQVRKHYLTSAPCPLQKAEVATGEFMAICTNWAWLVAKVSDREQFVPWLERFLPSELSMEPIAAPASTHQVGLNFSRAWGLWALYRKTDDPRFLSLYLRHIHATYDQPRLWKGDYRSVAHWVAQFGMLALIVSYYDWP